MNKVYLRLSHGFGNQLFQTAFGLWAARGDTTRLAFDPTWYTDAPKRATPRDLMVPRVLSKLEIPCVRPEVFLPKNVLQIHSIMARDAYLEAMRETADQLSIHFEGLFMNYRYVAESIDQMRAAFHASEANLSEDDRRFFAENSVIGVHVRRGDFRRADVRTWLGLVDPQDQLREITRIAKTVKFDRPVKIAVFSDEQVQHDFDRSYISKAAGGAYDDVETLKLMGLCDWLVTANSTFSIFAAYLSETMQGASLPMNYAHRRGVQSPALLGPNMALYDNSLM